MERDRVKFFSSTDLTCGIYLEVVQQVIQRFNERETYTDVNDIIEFYNIKRFFDHEIYLIKWSVEERTNYANIVKDFSKHLGKYFGTITDANFLLVFKSVEIRYTEDFWYLTDYYKSYRNLTSPFFVESFAVPHFRLYEVLEQQKIVQHFGKELKEFILSDCEHAEILLDRYISRVGNERELYFPCELTGEDMEILILQYIRSKDPNPNYLELIASIQSTKEFPITDMTRLEAKRRYKEFTDKHFDGSNGFEYSIEVSFSNQQIEEKIIEQSEGKFSGSYSTKWIRNNLDFPTLLNNFIYLFEFTDIYARSLHVHKEHELGVFERIMGIKGRTYYFTGIAFEQIQSLSILQMFGYRQELKNSGIRLEDIIQWFFLSYIPNEFGISGFRISVPSESSTDLEKCRMLASEIEGILKQFSLLVEFGHIDHELLQMSSRHLFYKDVPSFLNPKYVYGIGHTYQHATHYFFSDQSMLAYVPRLREKYYNFYDLLCHEKVGLNDYSRHKHDIEWLLEQSFLRLNDDGNISMHTEKVIILKDLYENGVSCASYLKKYKDVLNWMEAQDMAGYKSSFFSKPEQDYLNYLMNRSEFSNGLDLRNTYLHATQSADEEIHKKNYNIFLNVIVLIIIKMNEEFCLRQELTL